VKIKIFNINSVVALGPTTELISRFGFYFFVTNSLFVHRRKTVFNFWHCPHSMRSGVYATVGRPSVRLYVPFAAATGLLLWARRVGDIDRLLHGRAPPPSAARDSKCG